MSEAADTCLVSTVLLPTSGHHGPDTIAVARLCDSPPYVSSERPTEGIVTAELSSPSVRGSRLAQYTRLHSRCLTFLSTTPGQLSHRPAPRPANHLKSSNWAHPSPHELFAV